jgi:hypothetical protein
MRFFLFAFLFCVFSYAQVPQHCGYDFTSYLVLNVHEEGNSKNITGLKLTLVDLEGKEIINTNNQYSWKDNNKELVFSFNYLIDENNKRIEQSIEGIKERWFFPYAKDNYFLSIVNTFPADQIKVKIEDIDGKENGGFFETQIVELGYFDLFVLCSNQTRDYAVQFGRKANKPLEVVLVKK